MVSARVAEAIEANSDSFGSVFHGYTYSGHPVGCAAGLAALAETKRLKLNENAAARGEQLMAGLETFKARYKLVGDVRGKGLMAALELVSDRDLKTPVGADVTRRIGDAAYKAGVMIRISGPTIILSPPLIVTAAHVDTILNALDSALAQESKHAA
jgi:adenosylmethionine-8-amino-7-oxononanoate aminotransferase